jgi:hypothetical protein
MIEYLMNTNIALEAGSIAAGLWLVLLAGRY